MRGTVSCVRTDRWDECDRSCCAERRLALLSQTLVDVPDRTFQVLTPSFEPFDVPGLEIEASDGSSREREENEDSQSIA